jgi:preprotein translocase subunit SecY
MIFFIQWKKNTFTNNCSFNKVKIDHMKFLSKTLTGISGLDEITMGGIPQGRPTLICGGPGCGKTLFSIAFLVNGATRFKEPGVFITFEEKTEELTMNVASLGFDLEKLQKEGESGRKKINEYTRYATVFLCIGQSWFYLGFLINQGLVKEAYLDNNSLGFGWQLVTVMTMTAGTIFLMWIGEQIDEYGIGNGISLLIMAGILARIPKAIQELYEGFLKEGVKLGGDRGIESLLILGILFIVVIWGVIFITQGQRRIPTQSAKHVRGRRVWGGQKQSLPLRVNQAGVMPIIFASSLLMFPQLALQQIMQTSWSNYWIFQQLSMSFGGERGYVYNVCYIALIYFFCYFWTAITFNPKDMANNLKDYGSFIPGHRPGKRTADYLERVMVRITYVGAAFLALVAVIPTVIQGFLNVDFVIASFFGGTGLLIVVSVGLDLVQKIDSHLVMRNYGGLLES